MLDSPFSQYRNILVSENYSAAKALQDFALSCYNGNMAQFRGDALRNFDANHMAIFLELARHYHEHGENDPCLLEVGATIWENRRRAGRKVLDDLAALKAIAPADFQDGTEKDYWDEVRWLEKTASDLKKQGWIPQA